MKELDLYKFVKDKGIEYHWHDNDVIIFITHYHIKELMNLLGNRYLTDRETECILKDGYICLWMQDICDYHDIDMEKIFIKKDEQ